MCLLMPHGRVVESSAFQDIMQDIVSDESRMLALVGMFPPRNKFLYRVLFLYRVEVSNCVLPVDIIH